MTQTKWTQEPWDFETRQIFKAGPSDRIIGSRIIANCVPDAPSDSKELSETRANATRIVSCVNAMAGIENPEEFVAAAKGLLAASKGALGCCEINCANSNIMEKWVIRAEKAFKEE